MEKDVKKILITNEQIVARCKELGEQITEDYKGKRPLIIGLLNGSVPFMAELIKNINLYANIGFIRATSYYGGTQTTGEVIIQKDTDISVKDQDVIIVEDIIDSGYTLDAIVHLLRKRGAKSVEIVTLLDKKERRVKQVDVKYVGFDVPDEFVIGFGLDYNEYYRNLPYVGVLKEEVYKRGNS